MGVQTGQLRPKWPQGSLHGLVDVTLRCWAQDPEARPTFSDIIKELDEVEAVLRTELLARPDVAPSTSLASAIRGGRSLSTAAAAWGQGPARASHGPADAAAAAAPAVAVAQVSPPAAVYDEREGAGGASSYMSACL